MTLRTRITSILAALALCSGLAHAAAAMTLTPEHVERFIASMPESMELGEKYDNGNYHDIDPGRPMTSSLENMSPDDDAYKALTELAARHGFANAEEWAEVGDRTMNAYILAISGVSASGRDAAYQQGIANVMSDPNLTQEQKAAILAGMAKGNQRNAAQAESSEKDVSAIRPHMAELNKLFE